MIQQFFISREFQDCGPLPDLLKRNKIALFAKSLISFEAVPFINPIGYDVIFFSSFRSAQFFINEFSIANSAQVACIGTETAQKLNKIGIQASFIGSQSGNPQKVAIDFKNWLGERTVLFPHSDQSLHSVANFLNTSQVKLVEVYKTTYSSSIIPTCDLYIFSIPSNLKSFLSTNKIDEKAKVIAWGRSTEKELIKNKIPVMNVLQTGTLDELVSFLRTYFNLK